MNKEEMTIEAKDLLISDEEYNILNTEFHSIIGKFIKQNIKDKDLAIAQHIIKKQEIKNTNLKQALLEIRELINEELYEIGQYGVGAKRLKEILQIIDKVLGDSYE